MKPEILSFFFEIRHRSNKGEGSIVRVASVGKAKSADTATFEKMKNC